MECLAEQVAERQVREFGTYTFDNPLGEKRWEIYKP